MDEGIITDDQKKITNNVLEEETKGNETFKNKNGDKLMHKNEALKEFSANGPALIT